MEIIAWKLVPGLPPSEEVCVLNWTNFYSFANTYII